MEKLNLDKYLMESTVSIYLTKGTIGWFYVSYPYAETWTATDFSDPFLKAKFINNSIQNYEPQNVLINIPYRQLEIEDYSLTIIREQEVKNFYKMSKNIVGVLKEPNAKMFNEFQHIPISKYEKKAFNQYFYGVSWIGDLINCQQKLK